MQLRPINHSNTAFNGTLRFRDANEPSYKNTNPSTNICTIDVISIDKLENDQIEIACRYGKKYRPECGYQAFMSAFTVAQNSKTIHINLCDRNSQNN